MDGIRLQKIIASAGVASRRRAEELIRQGRVTVNGEVVTRLGARADAERDHIKVDGKLIRPAGRKVYVLLNKPQRVISSVTDPRGRTTVTDLVGTKVKEKVYPVGRLDYNTEGLILLTNDGELAKIVSGAGDAFPKVYHVKVRSAPEERALDRLRAGIRLPDGTQLARCTIEPMKEGNNTWFEVTLTQGRNQQIRKMFQAIGHPVMKLRRKRIGFLTDQNLPVGFFRFLTDREVERIRRRGREKEKKKKGNRRP